MTSPDETVRQLTEKLAYSIQRSFGQFLDSRMLGNKMSVKLNIRDLMAQWFPDKTEQERAEMAFEATVDCSREDYESVQFTEDGCGFSFKALLPVTYLVVTLTGGKDIKINAD